ncbi:MAG: hypothetical protein IJ736_00405, partial [Firmicutes bacterium]|nr:hypothetical protein [Bacillota bacterium]
MKKLTAIALSLIIAASSIISVSAENNKNLLSPSSIELFADSDAKIVSYGGWHESIFAVWENDTDVKNTKVYYKKSSDADYLQIDSELIRSLGSGARADIVGISAGNYDIKIVLSNGTELTQNNITADSYDRSGYAFLNNETLGGYNADGTPKSDADIIYVTNETKNTVTYNSRTGIGNILKNASKLSKPLIVRFIGTVDTQTRDSDGTKTTDKNNGIVAINGLTDRVSSGGDDTYFNMCDIDSAKNITVEGIGTDATIEKWGFTFSKCKYIEVRNLHFTKYPEDACSFLGSTSSYGSYAWLHNCTFDIGENKYDLTPEQDKHEGDGSTDVAYFNNITFSYNRFNNCHKTSLNGNGDKVTQYNITWHHNYFNSCGSRLPLIRQANMHSYNNYFYKTTNNCIDSRASAWIFSEANYFEDCPSALKTTINATYGDPVIKSYKDEFVNSNIVDPAGTIHVATDRAE